MIKNEKLRKYILKAINILFFKNICSYCKKKLKIEEQGICINCFDNLKRVSIKEIDDTFFLLKLSKDNSYLYQSYKRGKGSTFKALEQIFKKRREEARKIDKNKIFTPFIK